MSGYLHRMDYALPAMFIGLFVLQLISSKPKLAIHLSVAISDYYRIRFTPIYAR